MDNGSGGILLMDLADMAQAHIEKEESFRYRRYAHQVTSLLFCEDCGTEIPDLRRKFVVGVRTCISCQARRESESMESF